MKLLFKKRFLPKDPEDTENFTLLQIGGCPQEPYRCDCYHCESGRDCCGNWVCPFVENYLWGFITIGYYSRNV